MWRHAKVLGFPEGFPLPTLPGMIHNPPLFIVARKGVEIYEVGAGPAATIGHIVGHRL